MFGVSFAQIYQNIISYIVTQCKRSWFNLISRDCEFPENFCTMKIRSNFGILRSAIFQNHLGLTLDIKLNILEQTYMNTQNIYKTLGWLHIFQPILLRSSLLATYKTYITSQTRLAITGAIGGASSLKIYQDLGLESLKLRRWLRMICHFYN